MRFCERGLYNVLVHGIGFMALFTAFQTSSGFQPTVLKDVLHNAALGNQSLAIIYIVFALANFIAPPIVEKLGVRPAMIVSSAGYALFIAAFLKPAVWSILGSSVILGLCAAVLWTAQGAFITANTTTANRGAYSGIFWALLQNSLLIGNLFGYFALPDSKISPGKAHFFYEILFGVACGGVLTLFLLRRSPHDEERHMSKLDGGLVGDEPEKLGVMRLFVSTFKLMVTPTMLMLSVLIMYSGLDLTFWSAKYPTLVGDAFEPRKIGLSGILVGTGEILGGMTMGRLADKFGRSWVVMVALLSHTTAYYLIYINLESNAFSPILPVALVCSFLLGFGDSAVNTALYAELGERFDDKSAQAFALFKFFQSATAGVSNTYAPELDTAYQLLILMVFLLSGAYLFQRASRRAPATSAYSLIQ